MNKYLLFAFVLLPWTGMSLEAKTCRNMLKTQSIQPSIHTSHFPYTKADNSKRKLRQQSLQVPNNCQKSANGRAPIVRQAVVSRHNPHITRIDSLESLTVGNGGFAFTVDATGLQTFPETYRKGVCLGTFSDWGWHAFPNPNAYQERDAWLEKDFGRGHQEVYAAQFKQPGRQRDAANYLRENPHRLHLGNIGLDLASPAKLHRIDETLDLWTGKVRSRFVYDTQHYEVETLCAPHQDLIATHVQSDGEFSILFRFAYPTGGHSDDACDWTQDQRHQTTFRQNGHSCLITRQVDGTRYALRVTWKGDATPSQTAPHTLKINCKQGDLQLQCEFVQTEEQPSTPWQSFAQWGEASATHWAKYWSQGGFIDLGHVQDTRARELERRIILSQYLMGAQECGQYPPQETGLTYNSWFGKFHLEMTWWHLAHWPLWGRPELLDRPLTWYLEAENKAQAIARRQGFKGIRWMKMTDPSAAEAPSNVGSYLIWQQPHLIYLAELLYRSRHPLHFTSKETGIDRRQQASRPSPAKPFDATFPKKEDALLKKYGRLVEETAEFMSDFAELDTLRHRYILRGCIPAQETLNADSTVNPPFELNYWLTTLQMAQLWREREGKGRRQGWDSIIARLSPLAFNADSLYLAAETATQTYTNTRFTSDHPALLGALGILPKSRLVNPRIMHKTLDWIWNHWNWATSWGWDFPMTAMTCARLGEPSRAVDALLMPQQKNTYLVNGHNYQDQRLRVYMPGNGGLLTAVAMMAAGWDGCTLGPNPGFPKDWDVRWEGLQPMP